LAKYYPSRTAARAGGSAARQHTTPAETLGAETEGTEIEGACASWSRPAELTKAASILQP